MKGGPLVLNFLPVFGFVYKESHWEKKSALEGWEREREKFHLMFGGLQKNSNLLFGLHFQEDDDDDDIQIQIRACFVGSVLQGREISWCTQKRAKIWHPCIHSILSRVMWSPSTIENISHISQGSTWASPC